MSLPDIQNNKAENPIPINKVGVKGIRYPVKVYDKSKGFQHTIADLSIYVDLPAHFKGTHMSRFIEILNENDNEVSVEKLKHFLKEIKQRLEAKVSHIEIDFPYFLEKISPVSKLKSLLDYGIKMIANYSDHFDYMIRIEVPVHTLCPCSKEISEFSAHNQRSRVFVTYKSDIVIWFEDIVDIVESSGSCQVYPLLKREDEKYVTEYAYKHPKFVEDVVREIASKMDEIPHISYYKVEVQNMESIHNHDAYACIEKIK